MPGGINKVIFNSSFRQSIKELNDLNLHLNSVSPVTEQMTSDSYIYDPEIKVTQIETKNKYLLFPERAKDFLAPQDYNICAYDESINKFSALEGTAFLFSHAFVLMNKEDYDAACLLAFYFYTKSNSYSAGKSTIKISNDPIADSQKDYALDKKAFIEENTPKHSIVLIDGPLIGGLNE